MGIGGIEGILNVYVGHLSCCFYNVPTFMYDLIQSAPRTRQHEQEEKSECG